ncbi:tyrosine-type recombinase/integrase [Methanobacterium paludis]|uniref:Integrase family protein n=1 Tax=Methanobacterium paludis (strain DSM 25820 / JCM 18151 / SWAN1) TaxID=868131 RepID=F6D2F6_METPW|nr:tyrosine-type recombinase/integrase [Methanobacterium paludis]AEG17313.1 integrase family protein [Methanobacterium paludis]
MDEKDKILLKNWFIKENYSETTQIMYKHSLELYSTLLKKTITELFNEADVEEESNIRLKKRKYQGYILQFKEHLKNLGKSKNTMNLYISAILSFYNSNDILPPKINLPGGDIGLEKNYGRLITKKEIKQLIDVSSTRDTAIIYTMALSGMSQNEIRNLTIKKFIKSAGNAIKQEINSLNELFKHEEELIKDTVITLEITRQKVNYCYHTFIPPEATKAIIVYLRERCNHRDKRIHPKGISDSLFVVNKGPFMGEQITAAAITGLYQGCGKRSGFKHEDGSYRVWRSHGMRKYFMSTIINKTHNHELANYLVGHTISATERAYWFADPKELKKEYLKVLPYLSLDGAEVKDVKTEELKKYETAMEEFEEMKREMEDYKEFAPLIKVFVEDEEIQKRVEKRLNEKN